MEKIVDREEVKIYKGTYYADRASLLLVTFEGFYMNLVNGTGDGEHPFYIINCKGYGPSDYNNKEDFEECEKFRHQFKNADTLLFLRREFETYKIMESDIDSNFTYGAGTVIWSSKAFIEVIRDGDTFFFYCYQTNEEKIKKLDNRIMSNNY